MRRVSVLLDETGSTIDYGARVVAYDEFAARCLQRTRAEPGVRPKATKSPPSPQATVKNAPRKGRIVPTQRSARLIECRENSRWLPPSDERQDVGIVEKSRSEGDGDSLARILRLFVFVGKEKELLLKRFVGKVDAELLKGVGGERCCTFNGRETLETENIEQKYMTSHTGRHRRARPHVDAARDEPVKEPAVQLPRKGVAHIGRARGIEWSAHRRLARTRRELET